MRNVLGTVSALAFALLAASSVVAQDASRPAADPPVLQKEPDAKPPESLPTEAQAENAAAKSAPDAKSEPEAKPEPQTEIQHKATAPPADEQVKPKESAKESAAPSGQASVAPAEPPRRLPADSITQHTLTLPGRTLRFTATAGALPLVDAQGRPHAEMAYVAYALNGADPRKRPVAFAFNGGPGSSSAWLHIGAMGPWRFPLDAAAAATAPRVVLPNAETWLDFTDLVFIDPIGTGYSRAFGAAQAGDDASNTSDEGDGSAAGNRRYWSVSGDIESVSEFIQRWLMKAQRTASPKILVGESYGGFRGPKVALALQSSHGISLSALVLVSPVLDFSTRRGAHRPLLYAGLLPSMVAAAMEKRGERPSRATLAAAENYARGDYLSDLVRGPRDKSAVDRIVAKATPLIKLDTSIVRRAAGRVDGFTYNREANRPEGKLASLYDASVTGFDPEPNAANSRFRDPFLTLLNAPMTGAMLDLYATKLDWKPQRRYLKSNREANRHWNWGNNPSSPESVSDLKSLLAGDAQLRVLVAHGFTDLVTPYFATELILDQIPSFGDESRVASVVYPGGHMFYSRDASREAFRVAALSLLERSADAPAEPAPKGATP